MSDKQKGRRRIGDNKGRIEFTVWEDPFSGDVRCTVHELFVEPEHRGRGLGVALCFQLRNLLSEEYPDLVPEERTVALEGQSLRLGGGRVLINIPDDSLRDWVLNTLDSFGVRRVDHIDRPNGRPA